MAAPAGETAGVSNSPYEAKYAKDAFLCSKCRGHVRLSDLTLGVREYSTVLGRIEESWYHSACFFTVTRAKGAGVSEESIRGLSWLKWDDQENIREQIEAANSKPLSRNAYQAFSSIRGEHAKSARGRCGTCKELVKMFEVKFQCSGAFHHLTCLFTIETTFTGTPEQIQNYDALSDEAKAALATQFAAHKASKIVKNEEECAGETAAGNEGGDVKKEKKVEAEADGLLEAARRLAEQKKARSAVVVLGAAAAAGATSLAAAAVATASASAPTFAAEVAMEDDDEIQLLDVVDTGKPAVVTLDPAATDAAAAADAAAAPATPLHPIFKQPETPVVAPVVEAAPAPAPTGGLNALFARFNRTGEKPSTLSTMMESMPKRPRLSGSEMGKDELTKLLKKQADALWTLREHFEGVSDKDLDALMKSNDMYIPEDHDQKVLTVCDAAVFGAPGQCPKCSDGRMIFSVDANTYRCTGNVTEWTKCSHTDRNPTRTPLGVPRTLRGRFEHIQELSEMNSLTRRYYHPKGAVDATGKPVPELVAVSAELAEGETKNGGGSTAALRLLHQQRNFQMLAMGGVIATGSTAAAAAAGAVVGKQFIKRGTVVDGECTYASVAHVYRDEMGILYSCSLTQADMATNRNSYFKMQLLQHDTDSNQYYIFKSWGRVGTELGGSQTGGFCDLGQAIAAFHETFLDKTGNEWADQKYFRKRPGKMQMIDIDNSEVEKEKSDTIEPGSITKLDKSVQSLILRIFDKDMFKSALKSFDLDMEQMPLGKLSRRQLTLAYGVLNELQTMAGSSTSTDRNAVIDASNRFYSLIPHNFGHKAPQMLDTKEIIQKKSRLIENLIDIAIAVDLMKDTDRPEVKSGVVAVDPIDINYLKLKSEITPLPRSSAEFAMIEQYTRNSHGHTHLYYTIQIQDIFNVTREGEPTRFNDVGNRMLLWHGSRLSNFVGILSQGLRIAPPEAPATGYMFGKGIYFADMISKSANYCHPQESNSDAFLLLCDVALGQIQEETHSTGQSNMPLKKGFNSVKGMGYQFPDPVDIRYHEQGFVVPYGKATNAIQRIYLEYNEYIVYDVSQVRIRYLVRTRMTAKR